MKKHLVVFVIFALEFFNSLKHNKPIFYKRDHQVPIFYKRKIDHERNNDKSLLIAWKNFVETNQFQKRDRSDMDTEGYLSLFDNDATHFNPKKRLSLPDFIRTFKKRFIHYGRHRFG